MVAAGYSAQRRREARRSRGGCVWVGCQKSQNMLLFPLRSAVHTRPFAERTNSRGGTQTHTSPRKESLSFCQRRNPSQSSSPLCSSSPSLNTHTHKGSKNSFALTLCLQASNLLLFLAGEEEEDKRHSGSQSVPHSPSCILLFPSSPRLPPTLPSTPKEVTRPA